MSSLCTQSQHSPVTLQAPDPGREEGRAGQEGGGFDGKTVGHWTGLLPGKTRTEPGATKAPCGVLPRAQAEPHRSAP